MADELGAYVNKLFLELKFGELGVDLAADEYFFDVKNRRFIFEATEVRGGGGLFPKYKGLGYVLITSVVGEFDDLQSIPAGEVFSWLLEPPMFGSIFLQGSSEGGIQVCLKQEIPLSGEPELDYLSLLAAIDNLYSQLESRA